MPVYAIDVSHCISIPFVLYVQCLHMFKFLGLNMSTGLFRPI